MNGLEPGWSRENDSGRRCVSGVLVRVTRLASDCKPDRNDHHDVVKCFTLIPLISSPTSSPEPLTNRVEVDRSVFNQMGMDEQLEELAQQIVRLFKR